MDFGAKFRLWGWKGMTLQDAGLFWDIRCLIHSLHKHKNPVPVFKVVWSLCFFFKPLLQNGMHKKSQEKYVCIY